MPLLTIGVRNKVAESPTAHIVCGNSDYTIEFNFDEEWDSHETKTARFIYDGKLVDVIFTGNVCPVPIITNARVCTVGIFAGDLHTTTPALIECQPSILCEGGVPADPTPDVYAQLMEKLNELGGVDPEMVAIVVEEYLTSHPLQESDPTVSDWAKQPEKPTYTAKEVGALPDTTDIPTVPEKLPNPHKLTFTGAVQAEYDGSQEVTVDIPQGGSGSGGGAEWKLLKSETLAEDVSSLFIKSETPVNEFLMLFKGRVNDAGDTKNAGTAKTSVRPVFNGTIDSSAMMSNVPFALRSVNMLTYIHIKRENTLLKAEAHGGGYGRCIFDASQYSETRHGAWNDKDATFNGVFIPISEYYFKSGSELEVWVR